MHYLKQTAVKVKDKLFSEKTLTELQNNFFVQLLVLTTVLYHVIQIKDYLFKSVTQ